MAERYNEIRLNTNLKPTANSWLYDNTNDNAENTISLNTGKNYGNLFEAI